MTERIIYNGKIIDPKDWKLSPDNRSFRYGDGCFETIKVKNGKILLKELHFERLFTSLELLKFNLPKNFTAKKLADEILLLATRNSHQKHARVRLTFYRGDGGLYDEVSHLPNYIIQTWPLQEHVSLLNQNGLQVDFYVDAKKTCDQFSNIKSNNFLPYTMAALWAKENKLNDAILLNSFKSVTDATIANVFIVVNGTIKTCPLTDGAVNGVMRRFLLDCLRKEGIPVMETLLTMEDVLHANEVFFTNVIYGIKWVSKVGKSNYSNQLSSFLHDKFILPLFS